MENSKRNCSPTIANNEISIKKPRVLEEFPKNDQTNLNADNCEKFVDEADNFIFEESFELKTKLNKNQWKLNDNEFTRCVVEKVERSNCDIILTISDGCQKDKENINGTVADAALCHLKGPWVHTVVVVGDVISLKCQWNEQLNAYKVDKDEGFIITNPDTLISGTTVVGSLFCRRKAVLQDRFRGIDPKSSIMVIGSIVHEILQMVLEKGLQSEQEIKALAILKLSRQETAYALYGCLLTTDKATEKVLEFVPNIYSFMQKYMLNSSKLVSQNEDFMGKISDIHDIEENLWLPQLGLKGKVDASVRIQKARSLNKTKPKEEDYVPLEIKTGRATFSMEHKGQLILYQMMLNTIGRETSTGLLLYLSDNILREIEGGRNEQRDLIILRNDLCHYLTHITSIPEVEKSLKLDGLDKFHQPLTLPEPISNHRACSKCAYAGLCCTFAKTDPEMELHVNHPLNDIMANEIKHLNNDVYEYFIRWSGLLLLEEQEAKMSNNMRTLWTESPEKRQNAGRAVIDLDLMNNVVCNENHFSHTFCLKQDINFSLYDFTIGEYVIISTRKRLAIASGFIIDITPLNIVISLERNLCKNYKNQNFIIDKYDSQTNNVFNYTNLGILLENTTRAQQLREIIINKTLPQFVEFDKTFYNEIYKKILLDLNMVQRSAALRALHAVDYLLIKGLPGTGKTQTLVTIIRLLHKLNKSVLVTSHTNSAVDNLLLRLKAHSLPILRLGSNARINKNLHECSEFEIMKDCQKVEELVEKYNSFPIVGVTCLGAAHDIFLYRKFDVCIMDEATQIIQSTSLRALFHCDKFLLVGDPNQLPPLIRSREARCRGADESLFHRLDAPCATVSLCLQYRMNKTINKLANDLTYGDQLVCATNAVKLATINIEQKVIESSPKWLQRILHNHIDQAVIFVDTLNCAEISYQFASTKHNFKNKIIEENFRDDLMSNSIDSSINTQCTIKNTRLSNYTNYAEVAIIYQIVKTLLNANYDPNRIGIIAPYRAQVELLKKLLKQIEIYTQKEQKILKFGLIEVNTVDQYQGRDKDIIIYSCSKTGSSNVRDTERVHNLEILDDQRRLTVAITRAKFKLIIIGDAACLQQYKPFEKLLHHIPSMCKLQLETKKVQFSWNEILEDLAKVIDIK